MPPCPGPRSQRCQDQGQPSRAGLEPFVQWRGDLRRRRRAAARRPGHSSPAGPRPHGRPGRLSVRTTIRQEIMMTGPAIAQARETAARARENSEYVRSLLKVRQPQFAVALESAVQKLLRDHRTVCASSQRTDRTTLTSSTVTGSAAGVITRRVLPAPADVSVYELTGAGRALQPALHELLDWGLRYAPEPAGDDAAQPGWALLGAAGRPAALPAGQTCELRVGPEFFYLSSDAGTLTVRRGPAPDGDAVVTMPADTLYSLVLGHTTVTDAVRHSTVDGDTGIAHRALEPLAAAFTKPAPAR